jgi:hypothetical protein
MYKDHVKEAAQAHSNLSIWAAVLTLMEGSLLSAHGHRAEAQVVKIAKREMQRELKHYDKERAQCK